MADSQPQNAAPPDTQDGEDVDPDEFLQAGVPGDFPGLNLQEPGQDGIFPVLKRFEFDGMLAQVECAGGNQPAHRGRARFGFAVDPLQPQGGTR